MSLLIVLAAALAVTSERPGGAEDPAAVFVQNCSACHQKTGLGIPGAFPALAGDPYVVGAPDPVILTLLNGRGGMPRFRDSLSDEQIAAAITYIRSTWGNHAPGVAAATVASARAASGSDAPRTGGQAH